MSLDIRYLLSKTSIYSREESVISPDRVSIEVSANCFHRQEYLQEREEEDSES